MSLDIVPVAEPLTPASATSDPAPEQTPEAAAADLENQSLDAFEQKQPRRHRARSQEASPADVPRIRELTAKNAALAAEVESLKKPAAAPVKTAPDVATSRVASAPEPPRVVTADNDPQPTEERDPATGKPYENFTKFVTDHARWSAREEMRTARTTYETQQREETVQQEQARLADAWNANIAAAKTVHKDFEQIAYGPSEIPSGSLIDHWIREHPAGPLVLYSLKKDPTELRAMLALPLFEQTEALALLSQRLKPRSVAAVTTGAAPVVETKPVPRPPTPVRTGPMRTEPAAPDTDRLSLDDFAEATGATRRRRA